MYQGFNIQQEVEEYKGKAYRLADNLNATEGFFKKDSIVVIEDVQADKTCANFIVRDYDTDDIDTVTVVGGSVFKVISKFTNDNKTIRITNALSEYNKSTKTSNKVHNVANKFYAVWLIGFILALLTSIFYADFNRGLASTVGAISSIAIVGGIVFMLLFDSVLDIADMIIYKKYADKSGKRA